MRLPSFFRESAVAVLFLLVVLPNCLASENIMKNLVGDSDDLFCLPVSVGQAGSSYPAIPLCHPEEWATWRDVGLAMSSAPVWRLQQHWRAVPEDGFQPAVVALAYAGETLVVYIECHDDDIFNAVEKEGMPLSPTGDIVEILLRAEEDDHYLEQHICPGNLGFQLLWPSRKTILEMRAGQHPHWQKTFAGSLKVSSQVFAQPEQKCWRVLAFVPLDRLAKKGSASGRWRFSICRYDYSRGREAPILSSTSRYTEVNFHQHEAWGSFVLER